MGSRVRPTALLAIGLLAASGACGESSGNRPGVLDGMRPFDSGRFTGSSSGSSSGGTSCPTMTNGCNTLQLCGPQVTYTNATGPFPTAMGGPVVAGTYVLKEVDYYGMGTGWYEETFVLSPPAADAGADTGAPDGGDGGAPPPAFTWNDVSQSNVAAIGTTSGTLTVTGATSIAIDYTCPGGMQEFDAQYTGTNTSLELIVPASQIVYIYQKQ